MVSLLATIASKPTALISAERFADVCAVGAAGSEREEEEEGAGCQAALGRREGGARHLRAQEVVDPVDLRREIQLELLIVEHEHAA